MPTWVPLSLRRCGSWSAVYVLPTPGAMPGYPGCRPRAPAPAWRRTRSSISSEEGRPSMLLTILSGKSYRERTYAQSDSGVETTFVGNVGDQRLKRRCIVLAENPHNCRRGHLL